MATTILLALLCVCLVIYGCGLSYTLKILGTKHSWVGYIPVVGTIVLSLRLRDSDGKLPILRHKVNGVFVSLWPLYCTILLFAIPNVALGINPPNPRDFSAEIQAADHARTDFKSTSSKPGKETMFIALFLLRRPWRFLTS